MQENDRRLAELPASGNWDEVALASQRYVLGRVDGVELELPAPDGERADRLHAPRRRAGAGALRADLPTPPGGRALGRRTPVREQLEELRSGGWERSAREAETIPLIDTGRALLAARPAATLCRCSSRPLVDAPLRRRRPCSASPSATAPTR